MPPLYLHSYHLAPPSCLLELIHSRANHRASHLKFNNCIARPLIATTPLFASGIVCSGEHCGSAIVPVHVGFGDGMAQQRVHGYNPAHCRDCSCKFKPAPTSIDVGTGQGGAAPRPPGCCSWDPLCGAHRAGTDNVCLAAAEWCARSRSNCATCQVNDPKLRWCPLLNEPRNQPLGVRTPPPTPPTLPTTLVQPPATDPTDQHSTRRRMQTCHSHRRWAALHPTDIEFVVLTLHDDRAGAAGCGGCTALLALTDVLVELGERAFAVVGERETPRDPPPSPAPPTHTHS